MTRCHETFAQLNRSRCDKRRGFQRESRRDGDREGHRIFLDVRASPGAVLRSRHHRLSAQQEDHRTLKTCASRRSLFSPFTSAGADDKGHRRSHRVGAIAARRRRCY